MSTNYHQEVDEAVEEAAESDLREEVLNTDVFDYNLVDRGIPLEHLFDQRDEFDVNKDCWKDYNHPKKATATVGVAVSEAWDQAKEEFNHIRSKLNERLGTDRPSFDSIFDLLFGPSSTFPASILSIPVTISTFVSSKNSCNTRALAF